MITSQGNRNYFKYLIYLILGTTLFRLIYINLPGLAPQEAYYWNYSRHLALSYFDHPPILAYLIFIFTHLGKQSAFFVRIGCVLLTSGLTYLTFAIGKLLFDERIGFFSAVLLNSVLIFSLGAMIATPDTPMIFFWALSFYFFCKLILTQDKKWWYVWGISTGLAMLSKYSSVFILVSVSLFLVFSRENRKWLLCKEFYLALLLAVLVFSPVIIWNAHNNWASFLFQSSRRAKEISSFSARNFFGYLGAQIGIVSPLVYISLIYSTVKSGIIGFKENNQKFSLCFFWSFPIILFFTLVATKYWVKMNWVCAGYYSASIAGVALIFWFWEKGAKWVRSWGISALTLSLIFVVLGHILPVMKTIPLSPSLDTITGWKELAQRVESEKSKMDEKTFVVGYGYKVASEIAFYTHPQLETYSNNIVGESGLQFDFWSKPDSFLGRDAIFVYDQRERYKNPENLKDYFVNVEELEPLRIYRGGRVLTTFSIFKCYEYKGLGS
ncbi:MAG TPA: glycosyltransferase family 39 protein [candidate division Zixibacteria bacterium]